MIRTDGIFRYVGHAQRELFEKRGWMALADLGPLHGHYSLLMWHCDCGEVRP